MFNKQNKDFTECQFGFIPEDSCFPQLLSITPKNYKIIDCIPTRYRIAALRICIIKKSFKIIEKLLNSVLARSCFKQTNFIVAKCNSRCYTRLCFGTCFISYLYKRLIRRNSIIMYNTCRRHSTFPKN